MLSPAVDVAHSHHERMDGTGYPRGLPKENISRLARIVAITDAYDAITSTRCYRTSRSPFEALTIIFDQAGRQFDKKLAEQFVACIGVYPPGSIVEMTNGEAGIVLSVHPDYKLKPRIMLVRDADKSPRRERIIYLRYREEDAGGDQYRIRCTHPNGSFGINLQEYLERGLQIGEHPPTRVGAAVR